jgi:pimeloyl-ACP methyl ester carboxylesterase
LRSLVLIDALAFPGALPPWARLLRASWPVTFALAPLLALSKTSALMFLRLAVRVICRHPEAIPPSALAAYADNLHRLRLRAMIQTLRAVVPAEFMEIADHLRAIEVPTLIVWGRQDPLLPLASHGRVLHRAISCSELLVIDDCGHIPHEEWPDPVLEKIGDFLMRSA